jgi:hypothetical protein
MQRPEKLWNSAFKQHQAWALSRGTFAIRRFHLARQQAAKQVNADTAARGPEKPTVFSGADCAYLEPHLMRVLISTTMYTCNAIRFWQNEAKFIFDFNCFSFRRSSSSTRTAAAPEYGYASAGPKNASSFNRLCGNWQNEANRAGRFIVENDGGPGAQLREC